jgi:SAM-dependent methyltransferase
MAEWFEVWFNTEEYSRIYRHRNDEDAQNLIELILNNVTLPRNAKVLDLACGAGRHSILFAKNNFDVTAVDISDVLLNIAQKTAEGINLKINFINSDLRKLCLTEKFNLIINLFTSFGYFHSDSENEMVMKMVSEQLLDNAYFIIDFFNIVHLRKNLIPITFDKLENGLIKQERVIEGDRVTKKITVDIAGRKRFYYESVRAYSKDELVSMMIKNKLEIKNIFGSYLGDYFEESDSSRIIIIAAK